MADYRYCLGTVARRTTTGDQTITGIADALGSFTPKGLLIWGTAQSGVGYATNAYHFIGITDGARSRSTGTWVPTAVDAPSIPWANVLTGTSLLTIPQTGTQTATGYAANADGVVVFANGSFILGWSASINTAAFDINYLAFGGDDLSVEVGSALDPASATDVVTTLGLSDAISGMLAIGVPGTGSLPYAIPIYVSGAAPTFGMVDADLNQGVISTDFAPNTLTVAKGSQYQSIENLRAKLSMTPLDIPYENDMLAEYLPTLGAVTAISTPGEFTTTYSDADTGQPDTWHPGFFFMAFSGPRIQMGTALSPVTASTVPIALDFNPGAVLCAANTGGTDATITSNVAFSFGAAAGTGQANTWCGSLADVVTASTSRGQFADRALTLSTAAASESQAEIGVASVSLEVPATLTFDWTMADSTPRRFFYLAFEGATTPLPPPPPFPDTADSPIRWLRRTPTVSNDGKRVFHRRFQVDFQPGVGLAVPEGEHDRDPIVLCRTSDDGGFTWSSFREMTLGERGKYLKQMKLYQLGSAYGRVYEVSGDSPVPLCMVQARLDIDGSDH